MGENQEEETTARDLKTFWHISTWVGKPLSPAAVEIPTRRFCRFRRVRNSCQVFVEKTKVITIDL